MRLRNQRACLRCTRRKTGSSCWEFFWRENDSDGNRARPTAVIGTVEQLPTRDLAEIAELHPFRAYTFARPIGTRSGGLALSWTARVRYHSTTAAPSYVSHK
jgi:hypothetical protein